MASFVGKTGSSRQSRAILHTVSYLVNIRSITEAPLKNCIRIRVAHNKSREKFNTPVWL